MLTLLSGWCLVLRPDDPRLFGWVPSDHLEESEPPSTSNLAIFLEQLGPSIDKTLHDVANTDVCCNCRQGLGKGPRLNCTSCQRDFHTYCTFNEMIYDRTYSVCRACQSMQFEMKNRLGNIENQPPESEDEEDEMDDVEEDDEEEEETTGHPPDDSNGDWLWDTEDKNWYRIIDGDSEGTSHLTLS
jgi:hypothetical protein